MRSALVVVLTASAVFAAHLESRAQATPASPRQSATVSTLNGFVENRGQWPADVKFFASRGPIDATLLADALVLRPHADREKGEWLPPVVLHLPAAQSVEGQHALPTAHHFILAEGSASDVPGFERVVYRGVAPGIDLVVRFDGDWFAYDVQVAPGADLGALTIEVEGAECPQVPGVGRLVMATAGGSVEQRIGASWEVDADGITLPIESEFRIIDSASGRLSIGFEAHERDIRRALVIDPSLVWSTFVGGSSQELIDDVHVSPGGSVYLLVKSSSSGPTTHGVFMESNPLGSNGWVGKLSSDGETLEWATFLGGSETEAVNGIDVDADGSVVVAGSSWSWDFPTTPGSLQPAFGGGGEDNFVSRLTPDGSSLVWSTFLGGLDQELADALDLFPSGDVLVVNHPIQNTFDPPVPTLGAYDPLFDEGDYVLTAISADGTHLVFQTFFEAGISDVVCTTDGILVCGSGGATSPTTPDAFMPALPPGDPFCGYVGKLDLLGSKLLWGTFLGGDQVNDHVYALAVDAAGAVYAAGTTISGFPTTPGAFDSTPTNDGGDGFVAKLLPGGTGLVWSTYIAACCGGVSFQWDIAVDSAGNAISAGTNNEPNFPTTPDAYLPTYTVGFPASDDSLTKFDAFGETLVYSTYLGGGQVPRVGLDAAQDPYVAVNAGSGFPVTPGSYDPTYGGGLDTAVMKFDLELLPWRVLGGGLKGSVDTPNLAGRGALTPGSPTRLSVRGAPHSAPAYIVAGASAANLPFKGGTMVPSPMIIIAVGTSPQGALDLPFIWAAVPPGLQLFVQAWFQDVAAPTGFAASNALRMTSQ